MSTVGRAKCVFDCNNEVTHFIFMSNKQLMLYERFGDFIGISGMFKTICQQYHWYVVIAIDALRKALPFCFGFLTSRNTSLLTTFIH